MRAIGVFLSVMLLIRAAGAQEAPVPPDTPARAAEEVLAAFTAEDRESLKALAGRDEPDPWLVADELLSRGETEAALAFARASRRPDTKALPEYVAAGDRVIEGSVRAGLRAAQEHLANGRCREAWAQLASLRAPDRSVVGVEIAIARGSALWSQHRWFESHDAFEQANGLARTLGWLRRAGRAADYCAISALAASDYPRALRWRLRCREIEEDRLNPEGVASALSDIAEVYMLIGAADRALQFYREAVEREEASGDPARVAWAMTGMGSAQHFLGRFAEAVHTQEEALRLARPIGVPWVTATVLTNLGGLYSSLGRESRSLACHREALELWKGEGTFWAVANALRAIAAHHLAREELDEALVAQERALAISEKWDHRAGIARALGDLGRTRLRMGQGKEALSLLKRALELHMENGARADAEGTRLGIGEVLLALGRREEARASFSRALRGAERLRIAGTQLAALERLGSMYLENGEAARALLTVRRALPQLGAVLRDLDVESGAGARIGHLGIFAIGTLAAARIDETAEAFLFLESGRAGSLLEALGGRQALGWTEIPDTLRQAELEALASEARARAFLGRALDTGNRRAIRSATRDLDGSLDRIREVSSRIEREAKRAAGLFYPRAATLEEVQSWLENDEAMVLYGLCGEEALALVLTPSSARVHPLGSTDRVLQACDAHLGEAPKRKSTETLERLRLLLAAPLKLPATVRTVVVSPEGPLCCLPYGALFAGRSVSLTPSGTTHVLLREEKEARGVGVLALGDPDYGDLDEGALACYVGAVTVPRLPGTRVEVEAVGTVVLLEGEASESGLRSALAGRSRWRAVHLACHGKVNEEHPDLSVLVLSPTESDDGFLTPREIIRLKIPADLATLSACETARGRVVRGEGILGLTRAFMYAGPPRVLCSLWKVDDEATKALMVKFYELWNPKEGEGLPAAAALKRAQEFVRSHEKWNHPYYWAAWVLWGLPD